MFVGFCATLYEHLFCAFSLNSNSGVVLQSSVIWFSANNSPISNLWSLIDLMGTQLASFDDRNCEILTFWPIYGLHSHLPTFDVCVECRDCFRGFVRQKLMYSLWKVGWDKKFVHIFSVSICWWSPQWPNNHISSSLFKNLLGRKVNFVFGRNQ